MSFLQIQKPTTTETNKKDNFPKNYDFSHIDKSKYQNYNQSDDSKDDSIDFNFSDIRIFDTDNVIQRKPICACEGRCPRCKNAEHTTKIQTKPKVSHPLDSYEQQADRVADQILRNYEALATDIEEENDYRDKTLTTPLDELEDVDEGIELQTKLLNAEEKDLDEPDEHDDLETRLKAGRSGGTPLQSQVRKTMQSAFGVDFSKVRIHTDSVADNLSRSFGAIAFTSNTDIFFRIGRYDPYVESGRRLLAHELTHVVQQNPELKQNLSPLTSHPRNISRSVANVSKVVPSENVIQRQASHVKQKKSKRKKESVTFTPSGSFFFFDENKKLITNTSETEKSHLHLDPPAEFPPPGVYELIFFYDGNILKARIEGTVSTVTVKKEGASLRQRISRGGGGILVVPDPESEELIDPEKVKLAPGPSKEKEEETPAEGEGTKSGKEEESEGEGGSESGFEFGVFNLINMPDWANAAITKALNLLGSEEEVKALSKLLRSLRSFGKKIDEFKSLFSDPDKLLGVVLGIEESKALDDLGKWVKKPATKHQIKAKGDKHKGIVAIAGKVLNVLGKVKNMLSPLFKAHDSAKAALGMIVNFITEMEGFEELYENKRNLKQAEMMDQILVYFSSQVASNVKARFDTLRASFKIIRESFVESEFVTFEEIAGAIVSILRKLLKGPTKAALYLADKLGLDLEDHIAKAIAKILPKALLDKINDTLRIITKTLDEKFGNTIEEHFDRILDELEFQLQQHLIPEIKNALLSLSIKDAVEPPRGAIIHALREISKSHGESLPPSIRESAELSLGFNFSEVRVFHDLSAVRASKALNANAFTLGSHIYFGADQFNPASPLGYHLLVHELTHVIQQRRGLPSGLIQRDYKTQLEKLIKKFGTAITDSIIKIGKPTKNLKDKADTILKYLNTNVIEKRVTSAKNPKLPGEAYIYDKLDKNGKPIRIRRIRKWIGLLPALHIEKGIIKPGYKTFFDPYKKDREELRRNLGCSSSKNPMKKEQAHHLIPLELKAHPVFSKAKNTKRFNLDFNSAWNGMCLLKPTHFGSHNKYTKFVRGELGALYTHDPTAEWTPVFESKFFSILDEIRILVKELNKKGRDIDEIKK